MEAYKLTNGRKRAKYRHGRDVGNYILTKMISRAEVAYFMLNHLNDKTYMHRPVGITY